MKFKPYVYILASLAIGYGAYQLSIKTANKFVLSEIQYDRPHDPRFDARPLTALESQEVDQALSQNFTYFGCGGQAYVFFSEDGKYALKFFKQRHFREPTHLNYIPFIKRYRDLKFAKRRKKISVEYGSYKLGFELLPELTALIYVHLNKTSHLNKNITFIDKFKIKHLIDLDKTDFILQRRAELVHDKIDRQMADGDIKGAKATVDSIIDLIITRCKLGYSDKDPNIATNCGILGDKAIKIDVGRLTLDPNMTRPLYYKPELYHLVKPFQRRLFEKHPSLAKYLEEKVNDVIINE
jgi:hypothetical protein